MEVPTELVDPAVEGGQVPDDTLIKYKVSTTLPG